MGSKLTIVSVDLDEGVKDVQPFIAHNKALFTVGLDKGKVAKDYGIEVIPANIVVAPGGKIIYAAEGYDEKEILQAVRRATPVSHTSHPAIQTHPSATHPPLIPHPSIIARSLDGTQTILVQIPCRHFQNHRSPAVHKPEPLSS